MNMKRVGFLVVAIKLLHVKTMYTLIWIRYLWDNLYVFFSVDIFFMHLHLTTNCIRSPRVKGQSKMELFNSWLLIPDSTSLIINPYVL
jgi:hypothetical protein